MTSQWTQKTAESHDATSLPLLFRQEALSYTQSIDDSNNNDTTSIISSLVSLDNSHHFYPHQLQQQQNHHGGSDGVSYNANNSAEALLNSASSVSSVTSAAAIPAIHNVMAANPPTLTSTLASATTTGQILSCSSNAKLRAQSLTARPAVECSQGLHLKSSLCEVDSRDSLSGVDVMSMAQYLAPSNRHSSLSQDSHMTVPLGMITMQTNTVAKNHRPFLAWSDDSTKSLPTAISPPSAAGSFEIANSSSPTMAMTPFTSKRRERYSKGKTEGVLSNCPSGGGGDKGGSDDARTGEDKWTSSVGGQCDASTATSRQCNVCGEPASGHYFGALVCLPCKSFFIRCTKDGDPAFSRGCGGRCDVQKSSRNRCQFCRFQRCVSAGMYRKEKPEAVEPGDGQVLCRICGDIANGVHFGVTTCEGCKKFFRRGLKEHRSYVCKANRMCTINPRVRNNCRDCRYQKCIRVGMSREAIKMGRPKKGYEGGLLLSKPHSTEAEVRKQMYELDDILPFSQDTEHKTPEPEKKVDCSRGGFGRDAGCCEYKFALEATCHTSYLTDDFLDAVSMSLGDDAENGKSKFSVMPTKSNCHKANQVQAATTVNLSSTHDPEGISVCSSSSVCNFSSKSSESPAHYLSSEHFALPSLAVLPTCGMTPEWMRLDLTAGPQEFPSLSFPLHTECSQPSSNQGQSHLTPTYCCVSSTDSCKCVSPAAISNALSYDYRPHVSLSSASERDQQDFVFSSRSTARLIQPTCDTKSTAPHVRRGKQLIRRSFSQPEDHILQAQQMIRCHQRTLADRPVSASPMETAPLARRSVLSALEAGKNSFELSVDDRYSSNASNSDFKAISPFPKPGGATESDVFTDDLEDLLEIFSSKPTLPLKAGSSVNIQTLFNSDSKGDPGMKSCSVTSTPRKSSAPVRSSKILRQGNQQKQSDSALYSFENAKRPRLELGFYFNEDKRSNAAETGARSNSFSSMHSSVSGLFAAANSTQGVIEHHSHAVGSMPFPPVHKLSLGDVPSRELPQTESRSALNQSYGDQFLPSSMPGSPSSALFRHPESKSWCVVPWESPDSDYPQHTALKQKKKSDHSAAFPADFAVQPMYQTYDSGGQNIASDGNIQSIANTLCWPAGAITVEAHNEKHSPKECDAAESGAIVRKRNLSIISGDENYTIENDKKSSCVFHDRPLLDIGEPTIDTRFISPFLGPLSPAAHRDTYQMNSQFSPALNSDTRSCDAGPTINKEVFIRVSSGHSPNTATTVIPALVDEESAGSIGKLSSEKSLFLNTKQIGTPDTGSSKAVQSDRPHSAFFCETREKTGYVSAGFAKDRGIAATTLIYSCLPSSFTNHRSNRVLSIAASESATTDTSGLSEDRAQALQEINSYFLSLDNSCEKNDCGDADNRNTYDSTDDQRQCDNETAEPQIQGVCLSHQCEVCLDSKESAQGAHVTPVERAVCTRRHHRYWHCHNTRLRAVPMTASSQHTLSRVAEALRQFRHCLSSLHAQEEQAFTSSETTLKKLCHQADSIAVIVKDFLLYTPGANTLSSEDADSLCRLLGFDSVFIALSCQAYDTECSRFRELWNWTVDPSSPLFSIKEQMLAVAGRIYAIGMDNVETALLCALSLFSTDLSGLKRREAIHSVRVTLLNGLVAYVSSRDQWFRVRVQRLFSLLPEVRVLSAWYRAIVSQSRLPPPPPGASLPAPILSPCQYL